MLVINKTTLETHTDGEFYRLHSDTSFPYPLTEEILNDFGYSYLLDGAIPPTTEYQYVKFDGVEEIDGKWYSKHIAVDYTEEELASRKEQWRQSASCTPFQGRMALADAGLLASVETAVAAADEKTKVAWEYALIWQRNSPMIATLAAALSMTDEQIDNLFKSAAQISA